MFLVALFSKRIFTLRKLQQASDMVTYPQSGKETLIFSKIQQRKSKGVLALALVSPLRRGLTAPAPISIQPNETHCCYNQISRASRSLRLGKLTLRKKQACLLNTAGLFLLSCSKERQLSFFFFPRLQPKGDNKAYEFIKLA